MDNGLKMRWDYLLAVHKGTEAHRFPPTLNFEIMLLQKIDDAEQERDRYRMALETLVACGPNYLGPEGAHLLEGSCCSSMTCKWCDARATLAAPPQVSL
jgi:hypothetical protein